jgi:hypothetical protein
VVSSLVGGLSLRWAEALSRSRAPCAGPVLWHGGDGSVACLRRSPERSGRVERTCVRC